MAQPRTTYSLCHYLTDKWPDDGAMLEIEELGDETKITEELYDKYVHWDATNKNPKPKWSEIKDDFWATRTAELKKLSDAATKKETDAAAGKAKLKELGLTDDQITALVG